MEEVIPNGTESLLQLYDFIGNSREEGLLWFLAQSMISWGISPEEDVFVFAREAL